MRTNNESANIDLAERMKNYEQPTRAYLEGKCHSILRVDGVCFHTYTKQFANCFSNEVIHAMDSAATALLLGVQGSVGVYVQSDEISVLFTNTKGDKTQLWFDGNIQKICSVGASIATAEFNDAIYLENGIKPQGRALFDGRVFMLPKEDVCNYFVWRTRDARRNSVSQLARLYYSHRELLGKSGLVMLQMLRDKGVNAMEELTARMYSGCLYVREKVPIETDEGDLVQRNTIQRRVLGDNSYAEWKSLLFPTDETQSHRECGMSGKVVSAFPWYGLCSHSAGLFLWQQFRAQVYYEIWEDLNTLLDNKYTLVYETNRH